MPTCVIKQISRTILTVYSSIVFVHGLTGNREQTWTTVGASRAWPESLLPPALPTARVLTFGYDASVADYRSVVSTNRIGNHAWNLLTSLAAHRETDNTVQAKSFTHKLEILTSVE